MGCSILSSFLTVYPWYRSWLYQWECQLLGCNNILNSHVFHTRKRSVWITALILGIFAQSR